MRVALFRPLRFHCAQYLDNSRQFLSTLPYKKRPGRSLDLDASTPRQRYHPTTIKTAVLRKKYAKSAQKVRNKSGVY
jgi:hypothetical protein